MGLRTFRDRIVQTILYEAGGLVVVTPLYAAVMDRGAVESAGLMLALSAAVLVWAPLHNSAFDLIDLRLTGRVASDRPRGLRVVHAASCELSTLVVTLPILVWIGGHCLGAALAVDLGLTVGYTVYAYGFFVFYDWWRPVRLRPPRGRIR